MMQFLENTSKLYMSCNTNSKYNASVTEIAKDYKSRIMVLVNQMKAYEENITEKKIVKECMNSE